MALDIERSESLVHRSKLLNVSEQVENPRTTTLSDEDKTNWRSIFCTALLAFFTAVQFSLFSSSLWPYLKIIDKDASESFFGYIIGVYSFGQIIGSPLIGYWSNRIRQISTPLYATIVLMLVGNLVYICIELMPDGHRYWLLFARLIGGLGSSNISLLKAYTASASSNIDRSRSIAFVTGGVAVGMFLGPALQLFFIPLAYPGIKLPFGLLLNMYQAPAYTACLLNGICLLTVKFCFTEHYAGIVKNDLSGSIIKLPACDKTAVGICYFTRFTQILAHSTLETLAAPLMMALFAWSRYDVVENLALAQLIMSFLAFLTYSAYIAFNADQYLNFRFCCVASLGGFISFYFLTYSWPILLDNVQFYHQNESSTDEQLGCDFDRFEWCSSLKPVNVVLFYVSYVLIVGCSLAQMNISLTTIFSKIIGPRRQGTQQGLLQVSGGVARMLGPVTMSVIYEIKGPQFVWMLNILVIASNIFLWIFFYSRMVPLKMVDHHSTLGQSAIDDESSQNFIDNN